MRFFRGVRKFLALSSVIIILTFQSIAIPTGFRCQPWNRFFCEPFTGSLRVFESHWLQSRRNNLPYVLFKLQSQWITLFIYAISLCALLKWEAEKYWFSRKFHCRISISWNSSLHAPHRQITNISSPFLMALCSSELCHCCFDVVHFQPFVVFLSRVLRSEKFDCEIQLTISREFLKTRKLMRIDFVI